MLSFFFNDTATTEIYTLSLHDALPICRPCRAAYLLVGRAETSGWRQAVSVSADAPRLRPRDGVVSRRSEEHTSELQSRQYLVCRLLLEKKNYNYNSMGQPLQ